MFSNSISTGSMLKKVIIEHPLIPAFLVMNIAISLWMHLRTKTKSFEDYAMANNSLPTAVLAMTLLGTFISTGHFAFPGWVAKHGVLQFIPVFVIVSVFVLIGTFLAPYLVYFGRMKTAGDIMGHFYGTLAQILTGLIGLIFSVIVISGQLQGVGACTKHFLGLDPFVGILCFGGPIVLYSVWSGMRSISYSDVSKMVLVLFMVTWVTRIALQKVGGVPSLLETLPSTHTAFFSHPNFFSHIRMMCLGWVIPIDLFSPPIVQRMLISNKRQVRKMWYISAFIIFLIFSMLQFVTLSGLSMGVEVDVNDQKSITKLFLRTVSALFGQEWILDLICITILAVAISTLDSFLHALGILVVQDFVTPIRKLQGSNPLSAEKKTLIARMGMLCLGVIAIFMSYVSGESLEFISMWRFAQLFSPMVIVPLVVGIVGLKTDRGSWLAFCASYILASGVIYYVGWYETLFDESFALASFIGLIGYCISHIYLNGGIVFLKRSEQTVAEQLWLPSWKQLLTGVDTRLRNIFNLSKLAREQVTQYPSQSLAFSIAIFGLYSVSSIVQTGLGEGDVTMFMAVLHFIGITLCAGLMLEGVWPIRLKHYFPLYWVFTLFYCLPLGGATAFLRAHEGTVSACLFIGNFVLLSFLVSSRAFFWMSAWGIALAHIGGYLMGGSSDLGHETYIVGYGFLVVLMLLVMTFRHASERYTIDKLYMQKTFSHAVTHESTQPLTEISLLSTLSGQLSQDLEPMENKKGEKGFWLPQDRRRSLEEGGQQISEAVQQIKHEFERFNQLLSKEISNVKQEKVKMSSLIEAVVPKLPKRYTELVKVQVECVQDFEARLIPPLFPNVLANLLKNAYLHGAATQMNIRIDGVKRQLHVRDNGRGIPQSVLPQIFDLRFTTGGGVSSGVGLTLIKTILDASKVKIHCHARHGDKDSFTEFVMEFPEV